MRVVAERDDIAVHPDALDWAGIAVFKRAVPIYRERGYRTRLLAAAYRHRLHWTELVGGDVVLTMPHAWQVRFNASGIDPASRIDEPVDPAIVAELLGRIPDFARAYEPDGLTIDEFDGFGPTVRTLRTFIKSYHDLIGGGAGRRPPRSGCPPGREDARPPPSRERAPRPRLRPSRPPRRERSPSPS